MGCIATHTTRQGGDLRTEATRQGGALGISVAREGGALGIRVSLVCTVNLQKPFLRVEPEYVWLTESNLWQAVVGVETNRAWKAT